MVNDGCLYIEKEPIIEAPAVKCTYTRVTQPSETGSFVMIEMRSFKTTLRVILPSIISHTILHTGSVYFCLLYTAAGAFHDFDVDCVVDVYSLSFLGNHLSSKTVERWRQITQDSERDLGSTNRRQKFPKIIYFRRFTPFFFFFFFWFNYLFIFVFYKSKNSRIFNHIHFMDLGLLWGGT